jgi:5-oxopent-3-ene-1,2,5-tricarboxylate decarboxylase/2-hydroxyhepta-2,4-diene-1,7-dioate isomerase
MQPDSQNGPLAEADAALLALCARTTTATASLILEHEGYPGMFMPALPIQTAGRFAGFALTLRALPRRNDLAADKDLAASNCLYAVIDAIQPGQVLVVDAGGDVGGGIIGDVLATRLHARGAAGAVIDGAIRDLAGVREVGLPVVARCAHASPYLGHMLPADRGKPIRCCGVTVLSGDLIMADADGVLVIPRAVAGVVLQASLQKEDDDLLSRRLVAAGYSLAEAYPPSAELRRQYQQSAE